MSQSESVVVVSKKEGMRGQTHVGTAAQRVLRALDVSARILRWRHLEELDTILLRTRPSERHLVTRGGYPDVKAILLMLALHPSSGNETSSARLLGIPPQSDPCSIRPLCISEHCAIPRLLHWVNGGKDEASPTHATVRASRAAFMVDWHNLTVTSNSDRSQLPENADREKKLLLEFLESYPSSSVIQTLLGDPGQAVYRAGNKEFRSGDPSEFIRACNQLSRHIART